MSDFMRLFSEAFCLPITTFATGVETVARTMQCGGGWNPCGDRDWKTGDRWPDGHHHDRHDHDDDWGWSWQADGFGCSCGCDCGRCRRGDCCRSRGCREVKLVEWSLVRVTRGRTAPCGPDDDRDEHHRGSRVLEHGECMVSCNTSLEEFRNEILINYTRHHGDVDGKNLRVYVKVLARYDKPGHDYDDERLEALHEIRDAIEELRKSKAA